MWSYVHRTRFLKFRSILVSWYSLLSFPTERERGTESIDCNRVIGNLVIVAEGRLAVDHHVAQEYMQWREGTVRRIGRERGGGVWLH